MRTIDIFCTRKDNSCNACPIKSKCDELDEATEFNLWEVYQQGRADFEAECEKLFDGNPPMHFNREQIMWIKEHIKHDRSDERANVIEDIHKFFNEELDKLETDHDGIDEYYVDTQKANELLSLNKRLCEHLKITN